MEDTMPTVIYTIFRHLSRRNADGERFCEHDPRPVRAHSGKPLAYPCLRAAVQAADSLNARLDRADNESFTAGWIPVREHRRQR
jgi:hypothetical protein